MFTGKTFIALALSALLPAASALAAGDDTLVYCSEASPESFNPQIASSGPSFVASSQVLYNRLINFDPVKNTPVPSLATEWNVSPDGKTWTFTLRKGVQFNSNKFFKPTRDFNADDVLFSVLRQKDANHPYHNVSHGQYEYFHDGAGIIWHSLVCSFASRVSTFGVIEKIRCLVGTSPSQ